MKTLRFHRSETTDYLVAIKDRAEVNVVMRDRSDHSNYNAVEIEEFCKIANVDALNAFEKFIAKSLAFNYDKLRAEVERSLLERFTLDELEHLAGLPEGDPEQKLTPDKIAAARELVAQVDSGVDFL